MEMVLVIIPGQYALPLNAGKLVHKHQLHSRLHEKLDEALGARAIKV